MLSYAKGDTHTHTSARVCASADSKMELSSSSGRTCLSSYRVSSFLVLTFLSLIRNSGRLRPPRPPPRQVPLAWTRSRERPLLATHTAKVKVVTSRRVCPCLRWETGAQKSDWFLWTRGGGAGFLFLYFSFGLFSKAFIPQLSRDSVTETIKNDSKLNVLD